MVLKIGFLAWAITLSGALAAQETTPTTQTNNNDLLHYYDTELFQWSYSMFGGMALNFQNQSSTTIFGIKEPMINALAQYEDTNQLYRSYRSKTTAGHILLWGGMAATVVGIYMPIFYYTPGSDSSPYTNTYEYNLPITLGLMLGGMVSEIISIFVLQSGQESIFNAINLYNRHKISDYR
jgi:hypothetical protein